MATVRGDFANEGIDQGRNQEAQDGQRLVSADSH
jgi:hypothetical protein